MNLKLYATIFAVGLGIGGATGWKLHKPPPPAKTETIDKDKSSSTSTGPIHAEVVEYSSCPPCPSCGGPTAPMPTPRPGAARASPPVYGGSVGLPPSMAALLQGSRAEPESNLWSTLPPGDLSGPMLVRRTILDQGATVKETHSSDDHKTVETPPPLPKWLVGFEVVDPFTDRSYNVRGGHRVFDTPFFLTGSKAIGTKDWSVGAEVHF